MSKFAILIVALAFTPALDLLAQPATYRTYGLAFGPYLDGQDPNRNQPISREQIQQRMSVIAPYTNWIRTYGCLNGLDAAGAVARGFGLKVALGAWIGRDLAANDREVACAIQTALAGNADIVVVGSEVLLRGDVSEQQLLTYLQTVKQQVPPNVQVTTADIYSVLLSRPSLIQASQVVFGHFFPYWEGVSAENAVGKLYADYQRLVAAAGGKTVYVAETGWPSSGNTVGAAVPSAATAAAYFLHFVSLARARDMPFFYFEAFDEMWKAQYEGPQGAAWGLWTSSGSLKPGRQTVFNGATVPINSFDLCGGSGQPSIDLTFVAPINDARPIYGRVQHVSPADFNVAVYILVGSGWWTKPTFATPLTSIQTDCSFTSSIVTGGSDIQASRVRAYLIPKTYSPPALGGASTLPPELDQNAVASTEGVRGADSICGKVTDSGSGMGLGDVAVALAGATAISGQTVATGDYCFANLTRGSQYVVTASKGGHAVSPPSQSISSLSGAQTLNFTANQTPGVPSQPVPSSGSTGIANTVTLGWLTSGPVTANDVYLGTTNPPPLAGSVFGNTYTAQALAPGTQYYWRIASINANESISSPVWTFTTQGAVGPGSGYRFVPVMPCRVADTRLAPGPLGAPAVEGGTARHFPIPNGACNIPSSAAAYSLNVTVVPRTTLGFLTIWPTGQSQPFVSTLNSLDGRIKANAVVVLAGTNGSVSTYVTHTTEIILDINGYFVPATGSNDLNLSFYPLTPCRVVDTRLPNGLLGGPILRARQTREFPLRASNCQIPATAQAYSLNTTVIPTTFLSYLSLWPTGTARPVVSTLNALNSPVVSNAAIVGAGAGGAVSVYVEEETHAFIDINGYFAPPSPGGLSFYPVAPCRMADTRSVSAPILQGGETRGFAVSAGGCGIPAHARAVVLNATVIPQSILGFLTLWAAGEIQPFVSTLNSFDGTITSNAAIVPSSSNGSISAYVTHVTHLFLDVNGYFAP